MPFFASLTGTPFLFSFQVNNGYIDIQVLDSRIAALQARRETRPFARKLSATEAELSMFLERLPVPVSLATCTPKDVLRFLAWKDTSGSGKTQVHDLECEHLGRDGIFACDCQCRLSAGYVKNILVRLKMVFKTVGRGDTWDGPENSGNPACAQEVKDFLAAVKDEQCQSHVAPKQATPMSVEKVKRLCTYLTRELNIDGLELGQRFLLLRDRAFFCLQFFIGERGGDLSGLLLQEIRRLPDDSGLVMRQTYGKQRTEKVVVVKRCTDLDVCPVRALDEYIGGCRDMGVSLQVGYVFRKTSGSDIVSADNVSQDSVSKRLRLHLSNIGLYAGETTHSIRGGCAVSLHLAGVGNEQAMEHVGWKSQESWELYSRSRGFQSLQAADTLSKLMGSGQCEPDKYQAINFQSLPLAYNN